MVFGILGKGTFRKNDWVQVREAEFRPVPYSTKPENRPYSEITPLRSTEAPLRPGDEVKVKRMGAICYGTVKEIFDDTCTIQYEEQPKPKSSYCLNVTITRAFTIAKENDDVIGFVFDATKAPVVGSEPIPMYFMRKTKDPTHTLLNDGPDEQTNVEWIFYMSTIHFCWFAC